MKAIVRVIQIFAAPHPLARDDEPVQLLDLLARNPHRQAQLAKTAARTRGLELMNGDDWCAHNHAVSTSSQVSLSPKSVVRMSVPCLADVQQSPMLGQHKDLRTHCSE